MKTNFLSLAAVSLSAVLGAGLAVTPASAQALDRMKVTLPYAASAGNIPLPAGEYTIRDVNDDGNSAILQISSGTRTIGNIVAAKVLNPGASGQTKVTLRQSGDSYQIDKVWFEGAQYGFELPPPAAR